MDTAMVPARIGTLLRKCLTDFMTMDVKCEDALMAMPYNVDVLKQWHMGATGVGAGLRLAMERSDRTPERGIKNCENCGKNSCLLSPGNSRGPGLKVAA